MIITATKPYSPEEILLKAGSKQSDIWGGGVEIETGEIDYNSFINIRPNDNNPSNEILNPNISSRYEQLTKSFFKEIFQEVL